MIAFKTSISELSSNDIGEYPNISNGSIWR